MRSFIYILLMFIALMLARGAFDYAWTHDAVPKYAEEYKTTGPNEHFVPGILDDEVARKVVFKMIGDVADLTSEMIEYGTGNAGEMIEIITDAESEILH